MKRKNEMKRWRIAYKAKVENYADGITWTTEFMGTLAEAINWIYKEEDVVEIVEMYEIEE